MENAVVESFWGQPSIEEQFEWLRFVDTNSADISKFVSPWRNRLARSAVNRKVGGSSPPGDVTSCLVHLQSRSVLGQGLWQTLSSTFWGQPSIEEQFEWLRFVDTNLLIFLSLCLRGAIG